MTLRLALAASLVLLAACGEDAAPPPGADLGLEPVDASIEAETVSWRDLIPDEDLETIQALDEGRADPSMLGRFLNQSPVEGQIGTFNVVEDLDGLVVRMPGYILPLNYAQRGEAREFLLLPYHGACIHSPAPPPNQVVYLRSPEPIRFDSLWEPVWVEGRIEIERVDTDLAASAYAMTARSVSPYRE
ncbi:MAG: DUF3299 domain-containing protein [Oceanicaulis sp.]